MARSATAGPAGSGEGGAAARRAATASLLAVTVSLPCFADEQGTTAAQTVRQLRQQGWTVVEKTNRSEKLPGLPPYENLTRIVSITTYSLVRGDKTITCEILYDSQRDLLQENCADKAR